MTAAKYVTIWCDRSPDAPLMACGEQVFGDDAKTARAQAHLAGWMTVGTRDYCRQHSKIIRSQAALAKSTAAESEKA